MTEELLASELQGLISEARNPNSLEIDLMPTELILRTMNREDQGVALAVERVVPEIATAVERIVAAFRDGGRLIYIGAGTSGRLGVLDASECPPTFSVPEGMVVGIIAGGDTALRYPVEGAEDDAEQGARDLVGVGLSARDVVVGIAVSGRTPYVVGALRYAGSIGAGTVALSCNPAPEIARYAQISIAPVVGPEVVTGSTRLKSGTAQKLVLNMLTTASMIRLGKTYENLMVDLTISNRKLLARAVNIVTEATGCEGREAGMALAAAANDVKLAILIVLTGLDAGEARAALDRADGFLRDAIKETRQQAAR